MKDEIIDKIKKCLIAGYDMNIISQEELNEYWNYITNLQKENMKLIDENEAIKNIKYTVEETIYKTRIDKAIECINYYAIEDDDFNKLYNVEEQELLAILGDKE